MYGRVHTYTSPPIPNTTRVEQKRSTRFVFRAPWVKGELGTACYKTSLPSYVSNSCLYLAQHSTTYSSLFRRWNCRHVIIAARKPHRLVLFERE